MKYRPNQCPECQHFHNLISRVGWCSSGGYPEMAYKDCKEKLEAPYYNL